MISAITSVEYGIALADLQAGTPIFALEDRMAELAEREEYEACAGIKMAIDLYKKSIDNQSTII